MVCTTVPTHRKVSHWGWWVLQGPMHPIDFHGNSCRIWDDYSLSPEVVFLTMARMWNTWTTTHQVGARWTTRRFALNGRVLGWWAQPTPSIHDFSPKKSLLQEYYPVFSQIPGNLLTSMLYFWVNLMPRPGFPSPHLASASTVARHCTAAIQVEIRSANWTSILAPVRHLHLNFWLSRPSFLAKLGDGDNSDEDFIDPSALSNSGSLSII